MIGLFVLLTMARMPTLIEESLWFNIGFLGAQAVALTAVVWAFGKIYGSLTA